MKKILEWIFHFYLKMVIWLFIRPCDLVFLFPWRICVCVSSARVEKAEHFVYDFYVWGSVYQFSENVSHVWVCKQNSIMEKKFLNRISKLSNIFMWSSFCDMGNRNLKLIYSLLFSRVLLIRNLFNKIGCISLVHFSHIFNALISRRCIIFPQKQILILSLLFSKVRFYFCTIEFL